MESKEKINWKIGEVKTFFVKKGEQETGLPLKEGECYYTVKTDKETWIDVEDLVEAELLGRMVRIENMLEKVLKK